VSRWTGIAVQVVMFPAAHGLVPWALSLVATRHEWTAERREAKILELTVTTGDGPT
jgi:hypothetical protein